ncbi:MAG: alpha-glucosidase/alpha-galactosidase [Oscillospiraceae bacterium]
MNSDNRVNIAYIGGGSCNYGWRLLPELADEDLTAMVKLYDTEKNSALANEVIGNNIRDKGGCRGDIIYLACDSPEEALRDADFVILSIDTGTLEEQVSELHLPETYGIYQSSGDNSGLASVIKALKTLPVCADYARQIEALCPNAWVINLTDPMAEVIMSMKNAFPKIKLIGASNDTYACRELIATLLSEKRELPGIKRRDIKTNLLGISGFGWFSEISYDGEDLMPFFRSCAVEYSESGYEYRLNEYKSNPDADAHKVKFDLFLRYGLIPAVSDRTAAEFCPPWYLKSPKVMASWKFSPMTVNFRKKVFSDRIARVKKYMTNEALPLSSGTTEVPAMIRALVGNGNFITDISAPNCGQVENLPMGTIVTTNALISKNSVRPVTSGALPEEILGLSMRHAVNRQTVVRSVEEKDLDIAFNAFLNNPVMTADLADATELYREMLSAVRTHLLYFIGDESGL